VFSRLLQQSSDLEILLPKQRDQERGDDRSAMLRTEYRPVPDATDSHPNELVNQTIGLLFVDFVDEAVQIYRANSK